LKTSKKAILTQNPVIPTLIKLALPMIVGILGIIGFNLVDKYFVGRLGTNEQAVLGFVYPIVLIIGSIAQGIGAGATAVISRAIGQGKKDDVKRLTTDSLILGVLIVSVFMIAGLMTIDPLFTLLGANRKVLSLIKEYMQIWYIGTIFVVIPIVGNNAIRATGDTLTPSIVMLIAVLVNAIMDPMLIFGIGPFPKLGIAGAALSTVLARATTFTVALIILIFREKMITIRLKSIRSILHSWKKILYIGLPNAATRSIIPISTGIVTGLVASVGKEPAVAGFGVATGIEFFSLSVVMALSVVLGPFVGQNLGANRLDRVQLGLKYSKTFALMWGAVTVIVFIFLAEPIASIFSKDPEVIKIVALYLRIVSFGYAFQGIVLIVAQTLSVMERPIHSALISMVQMFVLYLPLAFLGSRFIGVAGIFGALLIAYVVSGIGSYLVQRWILKHHNLIPEN
jgi:putative MATE family efflux protein